MEIIEDAYGNQGPFSLGATRDRGGSAGSPLTGDGGGYGGGGEENEVGREVGSEVGSIAGENHRDRLAGAANGNDNSRRQQQNRQEESDNNDSNNNNSSHVPKGDYEPVG